MPKNEESQCDQVQAKLLVFFRAIKGMIDDSEYADVKSVMFKHMALIKKSQIQLEPLIEAIGKSCQRVAEKPLEVKHVINQLKGEINQFSHLESIASLKLKKLEKVLENYAKKIELLEQTELNLDELDNEDSNYVKLDNLKRKFMEKYQEICKLQKIEVNLGRKIDKPFITASSRIPEANDKIMELVNKNKHEFPDFVDILEIFKQVNSRRNLHYPAETIKDLAKETFRDVIRQLKQKRRLDNVDVLNSYMPEDDPDVDPADNDPGLEEALKAHKAKADEEMNKLLDFYANVQEDPDDQAEEKSILLSDGQSST